MEDKEQRRVISTEEKQVAKKLSRRGVAIGIVAVLYVVLVVFFRLTTDLTVNVLVKSLGIAFFLPRLLYGLIVGKDQLRSLWEAHKKAWILVFLLEVLLLLILLGRTFLFYGLQGVYYPIRFLLGLGTALLPGYAFFWCVLRKLAWHQVYWRVAVCLGSIFLFLQPVGTVPDEETHWWMAYHMANTILQVKETEDGHLVMRKEDRNFTWKPLNHDVENYETYYTELGKNEHQNELIETGATLMQTPLYQYAASGLGIVLGRLCGAGGAMVFLLGRIGNLLLFILAITYAIYKIPFGKMAVFLVALMPMTLQQAASYSYDVFITASVFVILALTLYLTYWNQNVPENTLLQTELRRAKKERIAAYLILTACCLLLLPTKGYVYAVFSFLPLLLVWKKRKLARKEALVALGILMLCLAVFALHRIAPLLTQTGVFSSEAGLSYSGQERYTLQILLQNPTEIIVVITNTARVFNAFFLESMIGTPLSWLNVEVNRLYIYAYVILLLLSGLRHQGEKAYLGVRAKIFLHAVSWFCVAAVFLGLLLRYSSYETHVIEGVQGRYFIPAFLPMLLTTRSNGMSAKKEIEPVLLLCALVLLFGVVQQVLV